MASVGGIAGCGECPVSAGGARSLELDVFGLCGLHLPRTSVNASAGVDAAHILPWADYDLDHVCNGICLCKHHHWAFDEGLLVFRP